MAQRFADAVTAIWHGRVEIDRFNELVLRAGLTWQQVVVLRSLREVSAAGRFSVQPVPHRIGASTTTPRTARSLVELFEALFDPQPGRIADRATRRPLPPPSRRTSTRWSAWTPTGCCARSRR